MAIGDIIKEQRTQLNMTQKELAKGICSEKYIYLIEKNERNPSAFILKDLNEKLSIDLFAYYSYSNYENSDLILKHRQNFDYYTENSDIISLRKESDQAAKLREFREEPLIYDIKMIRLSYKLNIEGKVKEAIKELKEIVLNEDIAIGNIALINCYVVLSTAYQYEAEWEKAEEAVRTAFDLVKNKTNYQRYTTTLISVYISLTAVYFNKGDYDRLIKTAYDLRNLHEKYNRFNRVYYVNFYLAYAYYEKEDSKKARAYFMDGVHSVLLFKNVIDIQHILNLEGIHKLADSLDVDAIYLQRFQEIVDKSKNDQ